MALKELIYSSLAGVPGKPGAIDSILTESERNNLISQITGLLIFDGVRYIQILEGAPSQVEALFETISNDPRHHQIERLYSGEISARAFQDWRMAYESLPSGILDDLAEKMAVYALEREGEARSPDESFGARLQGMFMDAVAAE